MKPTNADLARSTVLDHGQTIVSRMAATFVDKEPKQAALESTKVVHDVMNPLNDNVIERSSIIAQRGTGGSIQYAILLTSLLRSQNIPARIAIGLKYESLAAPPGCN